MREECFYLKIPCLSRFYGDKLVFESVAQFGQSTRLLTELSRVQIPPDSTLKTLSIRVKCMNKKIISIILVLWGLITILGGISQEMSSTRIMLPGLALIILGFWLYANPDDSLWGEVTGAETQKP